MTSSNTNDNTDIKEGVDSEQVIRQQEIDALYSEEFQTLLRVDALSGTRNFHPVYVLGYNAEMIHTMRRSYIEDESVLDREHPIFTVKMYGVFEHAALADRIGIAPSVIVLAPEIEIVGDVRVFIKTHRIPVLRMQTERTALVALPNNDYYGGRVYDTFAEANVTNSKLWTRAINIGLLVWLRTRGLRNEDTIVSLRDSRAMRRQFTAKPAPSFSAFASEQLRDHGLESAQAQCEHVKALPPESVFDFATHGSDHDCCDGHGNNNIDNEDNSKHPHPLFD